MLRTEKVSATNLKNLAYTILKNFNDDTVKNKKFTELPNCIECDKKIFASPNKAFTVLLCGHTVEILEEFTEPDSQFSTSSIVGKMGKQLTIQSQEIIDEEMPDVDNGANKDKDNLKGIGGDIAEGVQKRPIEVTSEETSTMLDKSPSKKAKFTKPVNREKLVNLKKLIDELLSNYIHPQIDEFVEESVLEGSSINFLYLFKKIDYTESRNEITNQEYKKDNGKEVSNALVFDDVRKQIPKVSDTALRKRIERARKIYKLFTAIIN
ncbi:10809_t:CDS:2, partial [Diversispora eburnea]